MPSAKNLRQRFKNSNNTHKKGTEEDEGDEVGVGEGASANLVGFRALRVRCLGAFGRLQTRQHDVGPGLARRASKHTVAHSE